MNSLLAKIVRVGLGAVADTARSAAAGLYVCVLGIVRMPQRAMRFAGVETRRVVTSQDVLSERYWFQVAWPNAELDAAQGPSYTPNLKRDAGLRKQPDAPRHVDRVHG